MSARYPFEFKQKEINLVTLERKSIAQEIKRLGAQNEAMKKEVNRLRIERDDAKEENRAAKLVIEYFRTHNPPKA